MPNSWAKITLQDNAVLYLMYYIALPVFYIFKRLKVLPNTISILSFISTFLGCYFLMIENVRIFILLATIGVILDLNDGQVARSTLKSRNHHLAVDHYLDLIKIGLVITSATLYFSAEFLSIFGNLFLILFYLYTVMNHDLYFLRSIKREQRDSKKNFDYKLIVGLWRSLVSFDAPFYLMLIVSIIDIYLFLVWLMYASFIVFLHSFKLAWILYHRKK